MPLTVLPGSVTSPTYSPDGSEVAFAWEEDIGQGYDLYVKVISSDAPLRLTHHSSRALSLAWSPDGRTIAFERNAGEDAFGYLPHCADGLSRTGNSPPGVRSIGLAGELVGRAMDNDWLTLKGLRLPARQRNQSCSEIRRSSSFCCPWTLSRKRPCLPDASHFHLQHFRREELTFPGCATKEDTELRCGYCD